jgi:hypothetical protein
MTWVSCVELLESMVDGHGSKPVLPKIDGDGRRNAAAGCAVS